MTQDLTPEIDQRQIWQKIPIEERQELLTVGKSKGVEVCALTAIFASACAFGLKAPLILLALATLIPILYQVVVARIYQEIRPQLIARYFVASKTATRYAQHLKIPDPEAKFIFWGKALEVKDEPAPEKNEFSTEYEEEQHLTHQNFKEVWICLFSQSLIMFSESPTGAKLELASSLLNDFSLTLEVSDKGNALNALIIEAPSSEGSKSRWVISSRNQSALIACERKFRFYRQRAEANKSKQKAELDRPRNSHSLFAADRLGATLTERV
jgi:hypothetical protein